MYKQKNNKYFSNIRYDLIDLIPRDRKYQKVLEIGCGSGDTLIKIKDLGLAETIIGIDLIPIHQSKQQELDRFLVGNIETLKLDFEKESFDLIICGDVLEHLIDPWTVLKRLKQHLKKDGYFIASIPNIRYYKTLKSIVFDGDFKYEESGILDRTHLRFFCRKNIVELFEKNDFKIKLITSSLDKEKRGKKYWLNRLMFNLLHDFFVVQYLVVAKAGILNVSDQQIL